MRLKGKTALVTAAGQGIGRASVLAMAAEGAQVLATDVNAQLLESYAGVANVTTARLDVMDKAVIQELVARIAPLDVLFNCAGVVHNGSILQATDDEWDFAFNLNVRAQYWMIQAALPGMLAAGGGSIINMSSVCSSLKGLPNRFAYGASKAAVVGLTNRWQPILWGRAFAAMPSPRAPWIRPPWVSASTAMPIRSRRARISLRASPWGAWRKPMKLRPSSCTWPATNRCLLPGKCSRWMAA
jgi:NAD(P)-dependent dehydrogenase (short-subunit alcohol dehydrogenase family)